MTLDHHPTTSNAPAIPRIEYGESADALDRLQASGALAEGKAAMISLEPIARRMGERWDARQGLVREHLERTLERILGELGFYHRLSGTEYLIAQPDKSPPAGQMACLRCLRLTLHHFFGEALVSDMRVHTVTSVGSELVSGERLDVEAVEAAAAQEARASVNGAAANDPDIRWSPFVASSGKRIRVSCSLEPVFQLKTLTRIGYRLRRRVLEVPTETALTAEELDRLATADIERIDFATVERGLSRLKTSSDGKDPSLILPVSFSTISSTRGRAIMIGLLKSAQECVQLGLICEICDIDGVPPGALTAAISFIRPFSLYVFGSVKDPTSPGLAALKDARLRGLAAECPPTTMGDVEFTSWAKDTCERMQRISKSTILYHLPTHRQAAIASLVGVSHGSLRPMV